MLNWFGKYFGFSRRELNGICVLGMLLLGLLAASRLHALLYVEKNPDLSAYVREIDQFLAAVEPINDASGPAMSSSPASAPQGEPEYFVFDPNDLPAGDWKRLGLSEGQIRTIKNYEAKGGRFRRKSDLKKIYTIDEADYTRLEPYIRISAGSVKDSAASARPSTIRPAAPGERNGDIPRRQIELNGTDSIELQQLPGIGPVFASRIVRFRDRLGGFHQVSQLLDVYGFDTSRFEGIKDYIYVDASNVRKIKLNTAGYDELKAHPHIRPKLANAIIRYREQHGPYRKLDDLLNIVLVDELIFSKLVPYLTLSDD
jgi:DNA uptake protein and related DNA-binding proteins